MESKCFCMAAFENAFKEAVLLRDGYDEVDFVFVCKFVDCIGEMIVLLKMILRIIAAE